MPEKRNTPVSGPYVVALNCAGGPSAGTLGGKAANLARMMRSGLLVPPGFCVTVAAFREWIRSCPGAGPLLDVLDAAAPTADAALRQAAGELRRLLGALPVPPEITAAFVTAAEAQGWPPPWAVRSSATSEDSARASFAGQHDTVLNVRDGEELPGAIRQCWLSLFSDRAVFYRRSHGLPQRDASMAVVVQTMVRAETAGVVFTADPLNGRKDRLVIEWVAGPAEGLVQGTAPARRVVVERASGRVVGDSDPARSDPPEPGETLPRSTIDTIVAWSPRLEQLFGGPQDLEWAQSDGRVWLLQSRPITTLPRAPENGPWIWSNMNVVENLPHVATPMTWSLLNTCFRRIGNLFFRGLGIDPDRQPPLSLVAGRVYMNVTTVRQILSALPGCDDRSTGALLGGYQDLVPGCAAKTNPDAGSRRPRLRLWPLLQLVLQRATWRGRRRYLRRLARGVNAFTAVKPSNLGDEELVAHFRRILDFGLGRWRIPWTLGPGLMFPFLLRRFTRERLGDADGAVAARLVSHAGGMASAEAAPDLWRLAVWASRQDGLRDVVLAERSFNELRDDLKAVANGSAFLERWDAFIARHGHRACGEVDMAIPRWAEKPDEPLGMLRHFVRSVEELDPLRALEERSRDRQRLLAECRARLRHPFRRWMLGFLVRQAQHGLVFRENFKSQLVGVLGYLRRLLLELGGRWTRAGVLDVPEDIFFLELDEIEPVSAGTAKFDARAVVRQRRKEFRANEALSPPPVVVGSYDPTRPDEPPPGPGTPIFEGVAVSPGVVVGLARVILEPDGDERVLPGEILVAPHTDPGWTPHFLTAAALVTDLGGQLSHGSVVAREYGLPAVVNVPFATRHIRTGQRIRVDGNQGRVTVLG